MASDEIVWQVINQQFCSYKIKTTKNQTFCRNEYNVSGFCSRQACPLANSQYASVRADATTGALYLYTKTIERAHTPARWWERVRLPRDYAAALATIDSRLQYWPRWQIHKCKQRLTRLTQVALRTRRLAKEEERLGERLVPRLAPKVRRREEGRERKALAAAKVERAIERELVERLRSGAYGDRPLNAEEGVWKKVLRALERSGEGERDVDLDEGIEDEEEIEGEHEMEREWEIEPDVEVNGAKDGVGDVEYVSDADESDEDLDDGQDVEDLGELEDWLGGQSEEDDVDDYESKDDEDDEDEDDGDDAESIASELDFGSEDDARQLNGEDKTTDGSDDDDKPNDANSSRPEMDKRSNKKKSNPTLTRTTVSSGSSSAVKSITSPLKRKRPDLSQPRTTPKVIKPTQAATRPSDTSFFSSSASAAGAAKVSTKANKSKSSSSKGNSGGSGSIKGRNTINGPSKRIKGPIRNIEYEYEVDKEVVQGQGAEGGRAGEILARA